MSELPEVRPADCGHGYLPVDAEPVARMQNGHSEKFLYLCDDCRARLRAPRVETKEVRSERKAVQPGPAPPPDPDPATEPDWREEGARASREGADRTLPLELRNEHPRSAKPRAWFAGWDEVKATRGGAQ